MIMQCLVANLILILNMVIVHKQHLNKRLTFLMLRHAMFMWEKIHIFQI